MTDIFVVLLYLFLYIIAAIKLRHALYLFILFIPLRNLIDIQLFGLFAPNLVFSFILFFHFYRYRHIQNIAKHIKNPSLKPLILYLIVLIATIYLLMINERILFQGYRGIGLSASWLINRTISSLIYLIILLVVISSCFLIESYRRTAYAALTHSAAVVVLSLYLAPFLASIGINIRDEIEHSIDGLEASLRVAGLYQGGNTNSVATFLSLIIGLILVKNAIQGRRLTLWSVVIFVFLGSGILLTASRLGFVTMLAILTYYFMFLNFKAHKLTSNAILNTFVFFAAGGLLFYFITQYDLFAQVLGRIEEQGLTDEIATTGHRYMRWMGYIAHSLSHTSWFLFGSDQIHFAFRDGFYTEPHNLFISILYLNGFISLFVFFWYFLALLFFLLRMNFFHTLVPIILPILLSMMMNSATHNPTIFVLIIGLLIQQRSMMMKNNASNEFGLKNHQQE